MLVIQETALLGIAALGAFGSVAVALAFYPTLRLAYEQQTGKWLWINFLLWLVTCALYYTGLGFAFQGQAVATPLLASVGALIQWVSALLTYLTWRLLRSLSRRRARVHEADKDLRSLNERLEGLIRARTSALVDAIRKANQAKGQAAEVAGALDEQIREIERFHKGLEPRAVRTPFAEVVWQTHGANRINGDMLDFRALPDGSISFFLGDAMGHGAGAGMIVSFLSGALASIPQPQAPNGIADELHRAISQVGIDGFATAALGYVFPDGVLQVTHCGHPPALLLRADGRLEEPFSSECPALGMFDGDPLESVTQSARLEPGDTVLFYTDGIEAVMPEKHGEASTLAAQMCEGLDHGAAAEDIVLYLAERFFAVIGDDALPDDFTLVAIKYTAGA